ncbi:hypothetical protein JK361_27705 [Streptomyces sp. 5-8]|uniref:Uncharacterized protein n=1 Tax=Streptomyces musisoli TaxID=2802280 RepID=A0ABS1P848_9ACTN|nr:hypothetical protein [Streptomyces musisoli]MBL1108330.1 hypothetical protein [Streptomyces musisoli]
MDTGVVAVIGSAAGLLGATIGAGGAIVAAMVTGRSQDRSQYAHRRRQVRREAYGNPINAAYELYQELEPLSVAIVHHSTMYATQVPDELMAALVKACHTVQLEGPADVAAQAEVVRDLFADWSGAVHLWEVQNGDRPFRLPELERLAGADLLQMKTSMDAGRDRFLTLARNALDATADGPGTV